MGKVFKTAVFGGFRKRDVVAYLDVLGQEKRIDAVQHDEELSRLETRNRELSDQLAQAKRELGESSGQKAQAARKGAEELAAKSLEWAQRERELLARLETQRQQSEEQINDILAQRDGLLEQVAALEAELAGVREAATPEFAMPRQEELAEGTDAVANRRLLADMKVRLIEVVEEINRLMELGEAEDDPVEHEETAPVLDKTATKLQSVNDILFYVRTKGERQ